MRESSDLRLLTDWSKWLIPILLLCVSFAMRAHSGNGIHSHKISNFQQTYTCPMHPEVKSNKPGRCPKCGMYLVPVKAKPKTAAPKKPSTPKKATPKKPEAAKAKSEPVPQKVRDTTSVSEPNDSKTMVYSCPMHPEIKSPKSGNCPKCGMKLVPISEVEGSDNNIGTGKDIMANIKKAKINLGPIRTVKSKRSPQTVRYDLYIRDTIVNYGKKPTRAIAANGQIPMPTLTFTEGDIAEIWVHNELDEETAMHWHGVFVPNNMDGVPFLTQMPIKPHTTKVYTFPIRQSGTHWYHSHSELQEQIGMYGSMVLNKREEWDIPTIPVVLSEWSDMDPEEIHRGLKSATDWFAIKKTATQNYAEAIRQGHFRTKLTNEWKRMNAMDVSDVFYDNFLVNGKNQAEHPEFKAGDKVRLRVANGGASDYFWMTYAGGKITVVANDGNEVEPVEVDRLLIAVSETYDVVVTIPDNKSYEFKFTPEDRTGYSSLWLGNGEKVPAAKLPTLKYFEGMKMMNEMMDMNGNMIEMEGMKMQNQIMDMNTVMYPEITGYENHEASHLNHSANHDNHEMHSTKSEIVTLNYEMLRSPEKTTLPEGPWRELKFDLTGNMNRYVWSLDDKVVSETDKILIKKGENLRIVMFNNSMMRHPMHLHGHDFRVVNSHKEFAPLKNVIDIMPMERDTIEFAATEPGGDWFFHCHILYHMMSGMGRVFSYVDAPANPDLDPKVAKRGLNSDDREFHPMAMVSLESNGSDGEIMLEQTRWKIHTLWHLGIHKHHGYESETMLGRYLGRNQWWYPYIGFDYHVKESDSRHIVEDEGRNWFGQRSNKNNRRTGVVGIAYTLPLLFVADARVDFQGKLRFQLSREDIPISSRLRFGTMVNTDKEFMAGFRYILTKYFSLSSHYDSDMGLGGGITVTY